MIDNFEQVFGQDALISLKIMILFLTKVLELPSTTD